MIATGHHDGSIALCAAPVGKLGECVQLHDCGVDSLAIVPGSSSPISSWSAGSQQPLKFVRATSSSIQQLQTVSLPPDRKGYGGKLAWNCDGSLLAVTTACNTVLVFDTTDNNNYQQVCELAGHSEDVRGLNFSPLDPTLCATASADKTVRIWRCSAQPRCLHVLEVHKDSVCACCWLPDGRRLVSGGYGGPVIVWDAEKGTEVLQLRGNMRSVTRISASLDGCFIAAGGPDGDCYVWDVAGNVLHVLNHEMLADLSFSDDSRQVITGSSGLNNSVRVWDVATGEMMSETNMKDRGVWSLAAVVPTLPQVQAALRNDAGEMSQRSEE